MSRRYDVSNPFLLWRPLLLFRRRHAVLVVVILSNCPAANRASTTNPIRTTTTSSSSELCSSADDTTSEVVTSDYKALIADAISVLHQAAETKAQDPEKVYQALVDLEKLTRERVKAEGPSAAEQIRDSLNGAWQLVFTTGTAKSQETVGRINYIPFKAIQTFNTTDGKITNGIYIGDFAVLKFSGDFTFDLTRRKVEFDFDQNTIFQLFDIPLKKGDASNFADKSGLGNKYPENRRPFFNWIDADEKIATARGGVALWKRVQP